MKTKKITYVAVFVAVTAVLSLLPPITLPFSPVPITLQTLGVMLSSNILGLTIGAKYAALSQLIFLLLVALGLPLLSGTGGLFVFFGPTGGYLLGFVAGSYTTGLVVEKTRHPRFVSIFLANIIGGIFVVYIFGILIQSLVLQITIRLALYMSLIYLPGDLIKAAVSAHISKKVVRVIAQKEKTTAIINSR